MNKSLNEQLNDKKFRTRSNLFCSIKNLTIEDVRCFKDNSFQFTVKPDNWMFFESTTSDIKVMFEQSHEGSVVKRVDIQPEKCINIWVQLRQIN